MFYRIMQRNTQHTFARRAWFRSVLLLACLTACLVLFAACANPFSAFGSTSTGTNALANQNANLAAILPTLQQSLQVTRQLKTVHIDLQGSGTIQTTGPLLPAFAQATPFQVHGSADVDIAAQAGKAHSTLKLTKAEAPPLIFKNAARLVGGQLYLQTPSHQWFSLNLGSVAAFLNTQIAHANLTLPSPQIAVTLLQHISVTDFGTVALDGQQVRHFAFNIDQGALGIIAKSAGTSQVQQLLASIQLVRGFQVSLFIDPATFHLVRLEVKGGIQLNVDALLSAINQAHAPGVGAMPRMLTLTFDLRLTMSKFDQPIAQITAPANATAIDFTHLAFLQLAG